MEAHTASQPYDNSSTSSDSDESLMPSDTDIHVDHQQSDYSSDEDLIQPVQETEGSEYLNLGAHAIFGVYERSSTYAPESDREQYSDWDRTEGGNLILPIQEMEGRLRGIFSEDDNPSVLRGTTSSTHNIQIRMLQLQQYLIMTT